ncbi:MAG: DUF4380 domain-containing protein [Candidatus Sumerlaeia bacterium]|nr:DUF4380 domain-containing protein [Candidatus Sumerlaeia bacterium]
MRRFSATFGSVLVGCLVGTATVQAEIQTVAFQGWTDCLEISNGTARVIVAPAAGGRILHYSRDGGPNFLWEDPRAEGDTLEALDRWFPVGGYNLDIGPEIANLPIHLPLWLGRYAVERLGPLSVRLTSPPDEDLPAQLIKEIKLDPSGAGLTIKQAMKNIGSQEAKWCLWDRTLTVADYAFLEINPRSRFPAGWSQRQGKRGEFRYDGQSPGSPRVQRIGNLLVTVPGRKTEKVGADSMTGWVAGFRNGWLYVKRFPVFADAHYGDGGNTVALYVDAQERTELEPMSPTVKLAPGQTYSFEERWDLRHVEVEITKAEDVVRLLPIVQEMAREPRSP